MAKNTVDKVLKVAEAEEGYLEKSKEAYKKDPKILYEKTAGAGKDNYTRYGKEMHDIYPSVMDFPAYWCDCFVDWCFYKAYGIATAKSLLCGNFDDYTVASADMFKKKNCYIKRGSGMPKIGDQVFFRNDTRICHTGIVYKVDNNYLYTVEGNTSVSSGVVANGGGVAKKKYSLSYAKIDGYGRPKYDKVIYSAELPVIVIKEGVNNKEQVNLCKKFLNWYGNYKLSVNGICDSNMTEAIKHFQKSEGLSVDGHFGAKSIAKASTVAR